MDFGKLTRAHVYIIGAVIAVIVGVGFYFLGISKTRENLTTLNTRLSTAEGTIGKRSQYEKTLADTKKEVARVEASLKRITATKMPRPAIDLRNTDPKARVLAMMQLWQEPKRLYALAQRFALGTNKVAVRTQFGVPAQPSDPNLIPMSIIELPIGTVTVWGEFKDVLDYMRRWNQFGRVVAVDNLVLDGTSPLLSATATLTVYIFPEVNPGQDTQAAVDPYGSSPYGGYGGAGMMGPGMMGPGGPGGYGPPGGPGGYGPPGGPGGAASNGP